MLKLFQSEVKYSVNKLWRSSTFSPICFKCSSNFSPSSIQTQPGLNIQEGKIVDKLFDGLLSSNRASLAQSITLIESTHTRKRLQARALLSKALQHQKNQLDLESSTSFRIGNSFFFIQIMHLYNGVNLCKLTQIFF